MEASASATTAAAFDGIDIRPPTRPPRPRTSCSETDPLVLVDEQSSRVLAAMIGANAFPLRLCPEGLERGLSRVRDGHVDRRQLSRRGCVERKALRDLAVAVLRGIHTFEVHKLQRAGWQAHLDLVGSLETNDVQVGHLELELGV